MPVRFFLEVDGMASDRQKKASIGLIICGLLRVVGCFGAHPMNQQLVYANQVVQVKNPKHARAGQAGVTQAANAEGEDHIKVKFDADGVTEAVDLSDIERLG